MSNVVGPSALGARMVMPLDPTKIDAARSAAPGNGADDIFFSIGPDHYVASGRGMKLRSLEVGQTIDIRGRRAKVLGVDDESNSFREGISQALRHRDVVNLGIAGLVGGLPTGAVLAMVVGSKLAATAGILAPLAMAGTLLGTALVAGGIMLAIGVGLRGLEIANRPLELDHLDAFARKP